MKRIGQLKKDARRALKGNFVRATAVALLALLPAFAASVLESALRAIGKIPAFTADPALLVQPHNAAPLSVLITLLTALFAFLVGAPVRQGGVYRWYHLLTVSSAPGIADTFVYFERFRDWRRSVLLRLAAWLRVGLWAVVLFAPAGLLGWIALYAYTPTERTTALGQMQPLFWLLTILWLVLAAVCVALISLRYLPGAYLLVEQPETSLRVILRKSVRIMRGLTGKAALFYLSFAPWYLPTAAALGVTVAALFIEDAYFMPLGVTGWVVALMTMQALLCCYVLPYFYAARACFVRGIVAAEQAQDNCTREYLDRKTFDHFLQQSGSEVQPPDALSELEPT